MDKEDNSSKGSSNSSSDYDSDDEGELKPYRPELENVETQKLLFLIPSKEGPDHPKTLYFLNDPEINNNKFPKDLATKEVEIKDKRYMIFYKAYKNLPLCLSGPMKYNNVIRSKLFENTNVIWKLLKQDKMFPLLRDLHKYQRFNHFPMTWQLSRKDNLYNNYLKMKAKFPDDYKYMPETYILPKDKEIFNEKIKDFSLEDANKLWLIKPVASSRGRGISLLTDPGKIPKKALVSHYISNPHLINNRKYDLRIYLLITGYTPLKIYLYDNGLARFCSKDYNISSEQMDDIYVHLTNYSINKNNDSYKANNSTEKEDGNKWTIQTLKKYFKENNFDFPKIWAKIKDILIKTIISVTDVAVPLIKQFKLNSANLFELYGVDILIDENLEPWLMEVNLNPSLNCDSQLDLKVKSKLLTDIFNIIGVVPFTHDGKYLTMDKDVVYEDPVEEAINETLCEFLRPSGGFERIFPKLKTIEYYKKYLINPGKENVVLWDKLKEFEK